MKRSSFLGILAVLSALTFIVPVLAHAETPAMTMLESNFRSGLIAPYDLSFSDAPYTSYGNWFPGITLTTLRSRTAQFFALNAVSVRRGIVFGTDARDLGFPQTLGLHGENTLLNYRGSVLAGDSSSGAITRTLTVGFVRPGSASDSHVLAATNKAGFRIVTTGAFTIAFYDEDGSLVGSFDGNGTGFYGLTTWHPFAFCVVEFRNPISSGLTGLLVSSDTQGGSVVLVPPTPPVTYPVVAPQPGNVLGAETRAPAFIVGLGEGNAPEVRLLSANGAVMTKFFAYDERYRGGVQVAMGDLDGDGVTEIVTAPGSRSAPHIRIFRLDGSYVGGFFAYGKNFRGGVNLAMGDLDGDGRAEIVTAPRRGGGPQVRVVRWKDRTAKDVVLPFLAYDKKFRGGVRVALGDLDGDGKAEIVTAPETGGSAQVRIFAADEWRTRPSMRSFTAFRKAVQGSMTLAVGDLDGDGRDEIVTGRGGSSAAMPKMFRYASSSRTMRAQSLSLARGTVALSTGGGQLATTDLDEDGHAELVLAAGKDREPIVEVFTLHGRELRPAQTFRVFRDILAGGMNVARGFLE